MKTLLGSTVILMLACGFGSGGSGDDDDATGNPDANDQMGGDSWAPDGLSLVSLELVETGGPTNTWAFPDGMGTSGTAMLVGVDSFPFTYAKTGNNMAVGVRSGVDEHSESTEAHGYSPVNGPVGTQFTRRRSSSTSAAPTAMR